jgi:hypothetical protein
MFLPFQVSSTPSVGIHIFLLQFLNLAGSAVVQAREETVGTEDDQSDPDDAEAEGLGGAEKKHGHPLFPLLNNALKFQSIAFREQ